MPQIAPDHLPHFTTSTAITLKAMSHATRLQILSILIEGEIPVGTLGERVGISQSLLSQHLALLLEGNLVSRRKVVTRAYYRCDSLGVNSILATLERFYPEAELVLANAA